MLSKRRAVLSNRYRRAIISAPGRVDVETASLRDLSDVDVLVATELVGVCGTDLEILAGTMTYLTNGMARYPIVPGHEWVGKVVDVGSQVSEFKPGDRIAGECTIGCGLCSYCTSDRYNLCPNRTETGILNREGGLASQLVFPAKFAHLIPPNVDSHDAALVEPLAVAYRGLQRLGFGAIEAIGIVGAGTIGMLAAMTARALGVSRVIIVDIDVSRRTLAIEAGFEALLHVTSQVDFVLEATGTASGVKAALEMTADGGRLVMLGLTGKAAVPFDVDNLVVRDIAMLGSLGSPGVWPRAIELIASGVVRPSALISHELKLDDAAAAFKLAGSRSDTVRKVIIRI
jgi:L-iditol 2-dehydrogenase